MARSQLLALIRHASADAGEADAALLGRFVGGRDEAAFAELVRRYARLIWGQCRNLLSNEADADDAFQATFLALAKSAKSVRDTDRLGPWLHAVAHRVCLNARRAAARRAKRERTAAVGERTAAPVPDSAWDSAAAAVHEEVNRLPETLRVAFVLCHLEGKAPTDAAKQLGLSWGTFSARLSRARQRLLDRLSARGLPAAVVLGAAASPSASAAVIERAITLGSVGATVPASVSSLIPGVVMGISRGKLMAVLAAVVAVAVGGPGLFVPAGNGSGLPAASAAPVPKESPEVKGKKLEELWKLLLSQDEAVASRTLLEMSARPKAEVVAFLTGKLKPLKLTEERATKLVADLGNEDEKVAKAAFEELQYFDPRLVLDVGVMLKPLPQGVHRQRLAGLLIGTSMETYAGCNIEFSSAASLRPRMGEDACANFFIEDGKKLRPGGGPAKYSTGVAETVAEMSRWGWHREWRRTTRAVMMLEHLAAPEAVKALEAMATGHADAAPTVAAKEALDRLKKK